MKTTIGLVLAVLVAVALGAFCLNQQHQVAEQRAQIAALHDEAEAKSQQVEKLRASQKEAAKDHDELLRQIVELNTNIQARSLKQPESPVLPSAQITLPAIGGGTNKGALGDMLSKMMSDPDMKQVMRNQQKQMMDMIYGPLFKKMQLTPEEADKFKDLMADNAMKGVEKAGSFFGGSGSNMVEAASAMSADYKSNDEQIKELLGDTRYAQYKDYEQTAPERAQLNSFKMTMGGDTPLTDQQTEQLVALMHDAKQSANAASGQPPSTPDMDQQKIMQAMSSPDQFDKLMQTQDTINQQVYENAKGVLSADQLQSFGRFQTNQLQMMRMGMKMAQKMFAPDTPAAGATQPGQ